MKAIVLHAYGPAKNLKYESFPDPAPADGAVLVRVSATSLNPIDWMQRSGVIKDLIPIEFPFVLGIDVAGTVAAVGDCVGGPHSDRVSFCSRYRLAGTVAAAGDCVEPGDRVMAMTTHTYAELCVVKATDLVKVPDGLDMTTAATLPLVNITGDQLIRLGAKVKSGQTVLITGALGAVGRSAVFAASEIGAKVIAGVRGDKVDAAQQLPGVAEAIAIDDDAQIEKLDILDCVADTVGGDLAGKLLARVKQGGTFGCFPSTRPDANPHSTVEVAAVFAQADTATTRHYAEAVCDGKLVIPMARTFPLADAAQAQAVAEKGGIAKVVLTV